MHSAYNIFDPKVEQLQPAGTSHKVVYTTGKDRFRCAMQCAMGGTLNISWKSRHAKA